MLKFIPHQNLFHVIGNKIIARRQVINGVKEVQFTLRQPRHHFITLHLKRMLHHQMGAQ